MRIDILTIFPGMFEGPFNDSIIKRARERNKVSLHLHDIREYTRDKHRRVDDYAYGGEPGMVMMVEPIARCIETLKEQRSYDEIIYTAPDGVLFEQSEANRLSTLENIIILCGRYKGIDERLRENYITKELSIGNYVLSGGELAAAVISDSIIRLLPGVLNNETSALSDSFQSNLVSPPVYTRPYDYQGMRVPDVLLSGNDKKIDEWRLDQAIKRTRERRPDLLPDENEFYG
ncbi:MAG: tRNA (guanosine(37)-N1)-methyltransferase TrmD [Bacteroidales bacterium]|nr:tRNA (guanosine(37)-N1)-methyltransferase TrmD [Bacteroidales bacterium]